jgi:hypothetical protein
MPITRIPLPRRLIASLTYWGHAGDLSNPLNADDRRHIADLDAEVLLAGYEGQILVILLDEASEIAGRIVHNLS